MHYTLCWLPNCGTRCTSTACAVCCLPGHMHAQEGKNRGTFLWQAEGTPPACMHACMRNTRASTHMQDNRY